MRRRLWRVEGGISDALRLFCGKLAAAEDGSDCVDAAARKIPEGKNAGTAREKCSTPGHRPIDRSSRFVSATAAQIDRGDRKQRRPDVDSGAELRRAARDHRR